MPPLRTGISPKGYIDINEVADKLGVCKTTAWAFAKEYEDFPRRRKFGARTTRWREDEIDAWLEKRIREIEDEATSGGM